MKVEISAILETLLIIFIQVRDFKIKPFFLFFFTYRIFIIVNIISIKIIISILTLLDL